LVKSCYTDYTMRILLLLIVILCCVPQIVWAQNTIFNSQKSNSGSSLYNSGSNYTAGAQPLSLKQLLQQGQENAQNQSVGGGDSYNKGYYGGASSRPYGIDNNQYSLAMSPSEVQASREARNAAAQAREREILAQLSQEEAQDATKAINASYQGGQTDNQSINPVTRFKQRSTTENSDINIPPKVFNSIY